jgi:hypothetical protein
MRRQSLAGKRMAQNYDVAPSQPETTAIRISGHHVKLMRRSTDRRRLSSENRLGRTSRQ